MEEGGEIKCTPVRRILIATDGSVAAERAVNCGIKTVGLKGAKVYAVYVIDITPYKSIIMDESWENETYEKLSKNGLKATSYVEKIAKDAGMEAESVILKGNPAEEILNFAEKQEIDMIVVGSHGKSAIERFTIGSVSEKVVRNAKVPVLVVHSKGPWIV
ncbi:universal stress protein [Methanosarcina hadiensis]|uniref:universal stress protein n=1 Tax=Methanosarcina hadiensis TaxID=3078083 RepID=UPI003977AD5F